MGPLHLRTPVPGPPRMRTGIRLGEQGRDRERDRERDEDEDEDTNAGARNASDVSRAPGMFYFLFLFLFFISPSPGLEPRVFFFLPFFIYILTNFSTVRVIITNWTPTRRRVQLPSPHNERERERGRTGRDGDMNGAQTTKRSFVVCALGSRRVSSPWYVCFFFFYIFLCLSTCF